jgi:hypothetical protein
LGFPRYNLENKEGAHEIINYNTYQFIRVLSSTYAALLDGEDEVLEAYLDVNESTYQVTCKYADDIPESDKSDSKQSIR